MAVSAPVRWRFSTRAGRNAVAPGIVPTTLFSAAGREDMVQRAGSAPLRRAGMPDEIASVVTFLLSDEAAT